MCIVFYCFFGGGRAGWGGLLYCLFSLSTGVIQWGWVPSLSSLRASGLWIYYFFGSWASCGFLQLHILFLSEAWVDSSGQQACLSPACTPTMLCAPVSVQTAGESWWCLFILYFFTGRCMNKPWMLYLQWLRSSYTWFPSVLWSQLKDWNLSIFRDAVWVNTELASYVQNPWFDASTVTAGHFGTHLSFQHSRYRSRRISS